MDRQWRRTPDAVTNNNSWRSCLLHECKMCTGVRSFIHGAHFSVSMQTNKKKQNKTHTQTISVYNSWQVFNSLIHSETETSLLENNNAHVYNLYRWIAHARLIHCLVSCRVQLIQWSVASRHNSCFPATTRSKKDSHSQRWQQECGRATLFWRY